MSRIRIAAAAAALLSVTLAPAVAGAGTGRSSKKPVKRTVTVADNYYAPIKLTVPKGSTITWKWPDDTGDTHDVHLQKGPKGVRHFESEVASVEYSYKQTLRVAGKYHIVCTLHDEMTMDITVK